MIIDIKAPSPGESINEVEIARWLVSDGDFVEKDQEIAEIESDKATLPLLATDAGEIKLLAETGKTIAVGEILCRIDTSRKGNRKKESGKSKPAQESISPVKKPEQQASISRADSVLVSSDELPEKIKVTPLARQMMEDHHLTLDDVVNNIKRITSKDIHSVIQSVTKKSKSTRNEERVRMTVLRRKLSQRLVTVKNETAMLTTFNEADMSAVLEIRKKYQEEFLKKHEVRLGLMSFFVRAASVALKGFPMVNSRIEGEDVIVPDFVDIGIAVQTEKGLMAPVIRNAENMSFAEIEKKIAELSNRARTNTISIEEMTGGTFTITNGGIFGSMLSTPILNPPQSAILGMHKIMDRPVAMNSEVVIRPMMYLALSYDHRIIDGKDSVSFLVRIRELIEDPQKILFTGIDPERTLLDL
jgi:2-oxoglutarate dehydrogenase E2 component (dihydrolipoamide succinyltransferase)